MNPNLARQDDGWYVNPASASARRMLQPSNELAPENALGLQTDPQTISLSNPVQSLVPHTVSYYSAEPNISGSRYNEALSNDMALAEQQGQISVDQSYGGPAPPPAAPFFTSPAPSSLDLRSRAGSSTSMRSIIAPSIQQSANGQFTFSIPHPPTISPFPGRLTTNKSPTYSLRPVRPIPSRGVSATQPSFQMHSMPQLPLSAQAGDRSSKLPYRKRKRARTDGGSPSSSDEDEMPESQSEPGRRSRPNLLFGLPKSVSSSIRQATQHLARPRPAHREHDDNASRAEPQPTHQEHDSDEEMDLSDQSPIARVDDEVVSTIWEGLPEGETADLNRLFAMVNNLLKHQAQLSRDVSRINTRTQELVATQGTRSPHERGTYVSPPEPPPQINWDQAIAYDAPAGRQCRARRRVLLMRIIRDTIFKLLSRRSIRDPLPPPPPASLRAPGPHGFAIRWQESSKSIFNQMAADFVAQRIIHEQPGIWTSEETQELPSMVTRHIKYLCRCYKDQNREDAEDFAEQRLKRCSASTRKRQLFATRLQVIDNFPQHLGKHRRLIVHLGPDGTSSDEEDPPESGIYRIKNKPELSTKVTLLKRDLDHVYQLYFKGPGTKGSQVHQRVPSTIESTRPFRIQGLPLSCVSRAWYQRLDSAEREFYRFIPHQYDFSFPMSLFNFQPLVPVERSREVSP